MKQAAITLKDSETFRFRYSAARPSAMFSLNSALRPQAQRNVSAEIPVSACLAALTLKPHSVVGDKCSAHLSARRIKTHDSNIKTPLEMKPS